MTRGGREREAKKKPSPSAGASTSSASQPGEGDCTVIPEDLLEISLESVNDAAEEAEGDQEFVGGKLEVPLSGAGDIESDFTF